MATIKVKTMGVPKEGRKDGRKEGRREGWRGGEGTGFHGIRVAGFSLQH